MRNLSLVGEWRRNVQFDNSDNVVSDDCGHIVAMFQTVGDDALTVDKSKFVLTSDGVLLKIAENRELEWATHLDKVCSEGSKGRWFSMAYLETATDEQIACISRNGAIVTVSPVTGQAELCGEFEHGLEGACWSPDRESLLLLTFEDDEGVELSHTNGIPKKNSVLLLMNSRWEVLAETTINSHVPTKQSVESSVLLSFRPDGSLCAVSTVDAVDNMRKIRFFNAFSLKLHAIGRTEDGSGKLVPGIIASGDIAWAGPGCSHLLVAAQRKGKKTVQVIFFEPNGLRHREFLLREDPTTQILGLAWNIESDLLAISLREEDGSDKVQLWHRSNYHWYMKQELNYKTDRVVRAVFDEERPNILYVYFTKNLEWREYEFLWQSSTVQVMSGKTCTAYAIDGSLLHMTQLDKVLIPPPMYGTTSDMGCPIRHVSFCRNDDNPVGSVVFLSDGTIVLLGKNNRHLSPPEVLAKGDLNHLHGMDPTTLRSLLIVDSKASYFQLLGVSCPSLNALDEKLIVLTIIRDKDNQTASISRSCDDISLHQPVLCTSLWTDSDKGALVALQDGSLWEFSVSNAGLGSLCPCEGQAFIEPCPWVAGLRDVSALDYVNEKDLSDVHGDQVQKRLIFGLSSRSRLYCRDVLLADNVSSFFVSKEHQFLCYCTAQGSASQLRFLALKDLESFDILMGSDENHVLRGFDPRTVERGARIVAILPEAPQAILQLPRGNLEGIYPRALVLRFVMKKIHSAKYGDAFVMMRKQKVNLNLIVDLNPGKFLTSDISIFLEQVKVIDHLNLFISCLQNWDSTSTQYRIPPWFHLAAEGDIEAKKLFDFSTKVNQLCAKMRSIMLQAENDGFLQHGQAVTKGHFLLPILSTFAKENPPKLEEALQLVKTNAERSSSIWKKPPLFSDTAQSSIQYLAFLADYELLFETALGMYDFELARAIARNSQMDPKEYLPVIKHYREVVPTYFGRYEIDVRLQRYEDALRNLHKSMEHGENLEGIETIVPREPGVRTAFAGNSFLDCMALISTRKLHTIGLELFHDDLERKRTIMLSLGETLLKENKSEAALTVFLATEPAEIDRAKAAARSSRNWRSYFSLCMSQKECSNEGETSIDSKEILKKAAHELANELALSSESVLNGQGELADAARTLLDYGGDIPGAVDMLIRGKLWQEGWRISSLYGRNDLSQLCVEAATSFAETMVVDLEERKATFLDTMNRYDEVIEIRKEAIRTGNIGLDQGRDDNEDSGSVFSVATNASNMSLQSNMSADSLSSVISIKSVSSFSISGAEDATRHKSKFNEIGTKNTKRKKKAKGRKRVLAGSAEELTSIVNTLRSCCVDSKSRSVISETIEFLARTSGALDSAKDLYKSFMELNNSIQNAQNLWLEMKKNKEKSTMADEVAIQLPEEEEVERLASSKLSDSIEQVQLSIPGDGVIKIAPCKMATFGTISGMDGMCTDSSLKDVVLPFSLSKLVPSMPHPSPGIMHISSAKMTPTT